MSFEMQLAEGVAFAASAELAELARRMVEAAGRGEGLDEPLEVCLRVTSDAEIRALNDTYRQRDVATDVLAFALREAPGGEAAPHMLGDVVISIETAERQRQGRSLLDELAFLFAHGLCHLLGYDHGNDREELEMNARARALLAESGAR